MPVVDADRQILSPTREQAQAAARAARVSEREALVFVLRGETSERAAMLWAGDLWAGWTPAKRTDVVALFRAARTAAHDTPPHPR